MALGGHLELGPGNDPVAVFVYVAKVPFDGSARAFRLGLRYLGAAVGVDGLEHLDPMIMAHALALHAAEAAVAVLVVALEVSCASRPMHGVMLGGLQATILVRVVGWEFCA